jgi:hypothetical protein
VPYEYKFQTANDEPGRDPKTWDVQVCANDACYSTKVLNGNLPKSRHTWNDLPFAFRKFLFLNLLNYNLIFNERKLRPA